MRRLISKTSTPKHINKVNIVPFFDAKVLGSIGVSIVGTQLLNSAFQSSPADIYNKVSSSVHSVASIELYSDPFSPQNMLERVVGTGTGFSYINEELVITNAHVVNNSFSVKVDDQEAEVLGIDLRHDVALLKVARESQPLRKCVHPVDIGTPVLALGNPYGFDKSLTKGIISGKERTLNSDARIPLMGLLQTDAAINPGNSGGPLLDARSGCVMGVNTALVSSNGVNSGVGFAIPIDTIDHVVRDMMASRDGEVVRLGVVLLPDAISEGLGIKGVIIGAVVPGSLASELGLVGTHRDGTGRPIIGDVILELNGKVTKRSSDIYEKMDMLKTGDEVHLKILKSDGEHEYTIQV